MQMVTSIGAMQRLAGRWRRRGVRIGLVPTMGYLHAGHLSLVTEARRRVGKRGRVVVSIYVNPTQFAPTEEISIQVSAGSDGADLEACAERRGRI